MYSKTFHKDTKSSSQPSAIALRRDGLLLQTQCFREKCLKIEKTALLTLLEHYLFALDSELKLGLSSSLSCDLSAKVEKR